MTEAQAVAWCDETFKPPRYPYWRDEYNISEVV